MKLFHLKVYFPFKNFRKFWEGIEDVSYSRHLKQRCKEKDIPRPTKEILKSGNVIECETEDDEETVRKIVVRIPCTCFTKEYMYKHKDYVYVVSYDGKVVSAWANNHKDKHKSLNREKYVRGS